MNSLSLQKFVITPQTDYQKKRFQIHKNYWKVTDILLTEISEQSNYTASEAIDFAKKVLTDCKRYELSNKVADLALNLAKFVQSYGDDKERRKISGYISDAELWKSKYDIEHSLSIFLSKQNKVLQRKMNLNKQISEIEVFLNQFNKKEITTYEAQKLYYELLLKMPTILNDSKTITEVCNEALSVFQKRKMVSNTILTIYSVPKIHAQILTGDIDACRLTIDYCYTINKKHSFNWFAVHSYDCLLEFKLLNFKKVKELLEVKKMPQGAVMERYEQYKAYAALFVDIDFKLGKFINSTIQFSRDKRGYNISILIAKMLHLLQMNKRDEFIDLIEKTKQYVKEWVNEHKVSRAKWFIRILLLIPQCRFNYLQFEKHPKVKRYTAELKKIERQDLEIEIVDYGYLLQFLRGKVLFAN